MDHENWLSQVFVSAANKNSSTDSNSNKKATGVTPKPQPEAEATSKRDARYAHDMAQAELMRGGARSSGGSRTTSPKSMAELTADDYRLGIQGLEKAQSYRRQGDLEAALKLYELSIELLLRYIKGGTAGDERAAIETKIHTALSEAEHVKTNLQKKKKNQPFKKPQLESSSSLNALSNALSSVLNYSATKPTSPQQNRRSPTAAGAAAKLRGSTTSPRQPTTTSSGATNAASSELRRTILSDFYVPPSDIQKTTWDDIAGLETVKQSLQETAILPLVRPDLFTGLRKPQNILLYGPPGTGKTLLAKAAAHESGSHLFVVSSSAVTSKFMGESEKLVRTLFQVARELAPCIVLLDECDALLSTRKGDNSEHEASRRMKTEFFVQMDGIRSEGSSTDHHVLLIGCSNCPWDIDPAALRRFPRRIFVPLPDSDARRGLIQYLLKKTGKHSLTSRHVSTLVKRTNGFSGSDITSIASEASFGPLRDLGGMDKIRDVRPENVRPVSLKDFEAVLDQTTNSISDAMLQRYDEWKKQQAAS